MNLLHAELVLLKNEVDALANKITATAASPPREGFERVEFGAHDSSSHLRRGALSLPDARSTPAHCAFDGLFAAIGLHKEGLSSGCGRFSAQRRS